MARKKWLPEERASPDWNTAQWIRQRTWPPRHVIHSEGRGWQRCTTCGQGFQLWMTSDAIWSQLPVRWWFSTLCVRCFRCCVPEPGAGLCRHLHGVRALFRRRSATRSGQVYS